jgi:mycofactocin system glycosyltransferase
LRSSDIIKSMSTYRYPAPGCYRLSHGVQLLREGAGGVAICRYPLRCLRLSGAALQLLALARSERSLEELACLSGLRPARVQALCEALTQKGLLEAGPPPLPASPSSWPGVSVIVPTRNRAAQLERCLRALCALDYPPERLEIIVVDDSSQDESAQLLQRLAAEFAGRGHRLRSVRQTGHLGAARSRNRGASLASYALLAFLDDDCLPAPDWLRALVPFLQDESVAAVGGMIRAYDLRSRLGRYEDVRSSLFMGVRPQEVSPAGPLTYLPTANLLVRRSAWQAIGGFRPLPYGEDVDFCYRLLAAGGRILYRPCGSVYHDYRTRLATFLSTRVRYASSEALLLRLHPAQRRVLLLPPEPAVFSTLVLGGLWQLLLAALRGRSGAALAETGQPSGGRHGRPWRRGLLALTLALLLTLGSAGHGWARARRAALPLARHQIWAATLRGRLAYLYHLSRHLARYYTLPLLLAGLLFPPLLLLGALFSALVSGVDYLRLRPRIGLATFALYALLDDCAYQIGVVVGCLRYGTWQPLLPLVRRKQRAFEER